MKTRTLLVLLATSVAISIGVGRSQDATPEQIAADQARITGATEQIAKQQAAIIQLTPEQAAHRDELRKKVRNIPPPPMPTNRPTQMIPNRPPRVTGNITYSKGERMANRIKILKERRLNGESEEMLKLINQRIIEMDKRGENLNRIHFEIYGQKEIFERKRSGGGDFEDPFAVLGSIYTRYNTPGATNWFAAIPFYQRWYTEFRSIVYDGLLSFKTLQPLPANSESVIYCFRGVTNHVDYYGDPADHLIATWYYMFNKQPNDTLTINISRSSTPLYNNTNRLTRTPLWSEEISGMLSPDFWTRVINYVPAITNIQGFDLSLDMYKSGPEQPSVETHFDVESAQWIPYRFTPVPEDISIEKIGNEIWFQWNTVIYRPQFWKLRFATDMRGPWADVTQTAVDVDGVSTIVFPFIPNQNRFYRFVHR